MCLLALYYLFKGRLLEGYFHSSSAIRFAVAMGFHRLNSRVFRPVVLDRQNKSVMGMRLWQPSDAVELGEAINLWWYVSQFLSTPPVSPKYLNAIPRTCCALDFGASCLNGLCQSVDPSDITTVWPRSIEEFEGVRQIISILLCMRRLIKIRTVHCPTTTTLLCHYWIRNCPFQTYRRTTSSA